jgi:membrane-associated phospholipid phosphatase
VLKPPLGLSFFLFVGAMSLIPKMAAQDDRKNEAAPTMKCLGVEEQTCGDSRQRLSADHSSTFAAETVKPSGLNSAEPESRIPVKNLFAEFGQDQKQIWTSPARIRFADAGWLVPLGGLAAGLFATDRQYSGSLPMNSSTISHYKAVSNAGLAGLVGAGAGMYLMSFPAHNEHWRETGFLAGEAALDSLLPIEVMKYSFSRERPFQGNGSGSLFHSGTSFPSEHSAVAWSIAGVIAHEYPGVLPKMMAYGTAAAIDYSRVRGRQHFPSDVLVGGALGYLVAQSVYNRRHEPELGGRGWDPPAEFINSETAHSPAFMGSPYVPLDSWIYPALERLAAMGYVRSASLGLRPWTRLECLRLVNEAAERQPEDGPPEVHDLYESLSREFASEAGPIAGGGNFDAHVESVYVRSTVISGRPLTDGQHFGQTISNDYGRPEQQGFNSAAGVSGWTTAGPFVMYIRGEHESSPSAVAPSQSVLDFISSADSLPLGAPSIPVAAISRFRLLDAYVGMNLANWQISFGRQSLWWSANQGGAMLFSNNAEPLDKMFRVTRVSPFRLPGILDALGDIRLEFFLGQLSGQEFVRNSAATVTAGQYGVNLNPQPIVDGAKISFHFTQNLEFNMAKTTLYGGPGNPVTPKTLLKSALGVHVNGEALGDGRTAWDFAYRLPKMRDWLSLYGEIMEEDEPFPINHPEKAAFEGGLYLARLPRIPHLDLRIEGGSTSPVDFPTCNGCYYHNFQYVNGYTNRGLPMGTWLGRAAQGESLSSTYWFSPRKKITVDLRHRSIDRQFLPQGGTQNDAALHADFLLQSGIRLSGTFQYESWQIPLLAAGSQQNLTTVFELGYWPRGHAR